MEMINYVPLQLLCPGLFFKIWKNNEKSLSHEVKNTELRGRNNYTADGADSMICSFEVWELNCFPVLLLSRMSPRLLFSRVQKMYDLLPFSVFLNDLFSFYKPPPLWTTCDSLHFIWKSHVGQRHAKAYQRILSHAISLNDCVCNFPEPKPVRVWFDFCQQKKNNNKINNTHGMFSLRFNLM